MNDTSILQSWDLGADATPTFSPRVTKLQTPSGCFYLKESESPAAAQRQLDLLEHLAGAGLPVPGYLATTAGGRYAVDDGKAYWLSRELPGHHFPQFQGAEGLEHVGYLARSLRQLHPVLATAPNPERFPVFRASAGELLATLLERETPYEVDRLQRLRGRIAEVDELPKQLIHRDFHRVNNLFTHDVVSGYLDFDVVHQGSRLFDVCYCATSVLSETFREPGAAEYWLGVVASIFRAYEPTSVERSLAWSQMMTLELDCLQGCLEHQAIEAALLNQDMLFWIEDHRDELESAIAAGQTPQRP